MSSIGRVVFIMVKAIHGIDRLVGNGPHCGINNLLNGNGNGDGIGLCGVLHRLSRSAFDRGRCKDRQCQTSIGGDPVGACNMN